jgi:NAD-reducing hydrogenase large subunit
MTAETRDDLRARLDEAHGTAVEALELFTRVLDHFEREVNAFGAFDSLHLGLANAEGTWEHYDGTLRVIDARGEEVEAGVAPSDYRSLIGEAGRFDSYLKSPYYKPHVADDGQPEDGMYRVGPLARCNLARTMGTPEADEALAAFRERAGGVANSSFYYHYARLVEILAATERMAAHLDDPEVLDTNVRNRSGSSFRRVVGCSEAPRGTLFHDYEVDEHGLLTAVNMIIATGQNNLAMNATVLQIAREWIDGPEIPEPVLNRIEAGIRAFDPCLSCSTHAIGQMPLVVDMVDADGQLVCRRQRD